MRGLWRRSWRAPIDRKVLEHRMLAQISAVTFGLMAAVACAVAFRLRRSTLVMSRQADELARALAARDVEHDQRVSRLEHDLKSPLGAILGFSTLLRELVHENLKEAPPSVLKSVNGIDQAARKMLQIIEAAGARNSHQDQQETVVEGNR
jgi:signal transduction histidine kinase